jgi:parvulin-like peptidyl-prolyl isomerase
MKDRRSRARWLLALGAAVGIALAMAGMLAKPEAGALPAGTVARVNDSFIRGEKFERAVAALASDRRTPLTPADLRFVLDRLIDEELLVQYGLSLGLAQNDRRIRSNIVSAVIAAQVASVDGYDPSEEEVRQFYAENRNFFRPPGRLRVRSLWVRAEPARSASRALARAREAVTRLRAGEPFADVEAAYGDPQLAPVPDALLPPAKLREYVGPSALLAAEALSVGEVSEPLVAGRGVRVLLLLAKEEDEAPALEAVEAEVRNEMKRRAGDAAVRRLLDQLRASGRLQTADVSAGFPVGTIAEK